MKFDKRNAFTIMCVMTVFHIFMNQIWPNHEDYTDFYIVYWEDFLGGTLSFTYPVGFLIIFAPLYRLWYNLPKLIFAVSYLVATIQVYYVLFHSDEFKDCPQKQKFWGIMYLLLSPLFAYHLWTGLFDGVIGLILLNAYLIFKNQKIPRLIKEASIFTLIILSISIKYIGVVLLLPFLFFEFGHEHNNNKLDDYRSRKQVKTTLLRLGMMACMGIAVLVYVELKVGIFEVLKSFQEQSTRSYWTFFENFWYMHVNGNVSMPDILDQVPIGLSFVVTFYSKFGMYIFIISLGLTYFYCYKNKVSTEAWFILPVLSFLTFYQASHTQFLMWIAFIVVIYYLKFPREQGLTFKLFGFQFISLLIHFYMPFAQFLYIYYILDIFKREKQLAVEVISTNLDKTVSNVI
ncbi:MAG: hypothetical protein ACTSUE_17945 [Promethearchaeota archaeon]